MKIIIKGEHNFSLRLPTIFLINSFVLNKINKYTNANLDKKTVKEVYINLKKYIKHNGHFVLVDINSKEDEIKIII